MTILQAFTFTVFMNDRGSTVSLFPIMVLFTLQYFILSRSSAELQDAYVDISLNLYCSKWYWMSVADQKMMLQIMSVSAKTKALSVGIFSDSNLERFTEVSG